jgi:hypothetical protein
LYGKTKEKAYTTHGPEFGTTLCGKNLIINKSLYGLKTSAARFHEPLAESLLRFGFKKTKHDPDLWMVEKTSHYEYLATYVDDILIWSKDPMSVLDHLRTFPGLIHIILCLISIQSKHHFEIDRYTLFSPRGPSKRYINLVIWSRPRVNTVCA